MTQIAHLGGVTGSGLSLSYIDRQSNYGKALMDRRKRDGERIDCSHRCLFAIMKDLTPDLRGLVRRDDRANRPDLPTRWHEPVRAQFTAAQCRARQHFQGLLAVCTGDDCGAGAVDCVPAVEPVAAIADELGRCRQTSGNEPESCGCGCRLARHATSFGLPADEEFHPAKVDFFRAQAIVQETNVLTNLVQKAD